MRYKRNAARAGIGAVLAILAGVLISLHVQASEPVTIRYQLRAGGEAQIRVITRWVEEFEKQNPDIKVEWEIPTSGWMDRLLAQMATGTAPDVFEIWGEYAQQYAQSGALLDLRPYVERYLSPEEQADFFPPSWRMSYLQHGPNAGIQFSLPRHINTEVFYYNADLFAAAGLENPSELEARSAWTWETFRDAARKLTRANGDDVRQWGFTTTVTNNFKRMASWIEDGGGNWFDPQDPAVFTGHTPEARVGVDFVYELIWSDRSTPPTWQASDFRSGRAGMAEDGIHALLAGVKPQVDGSFQWDIAPRPMGPAGRSPWITDDSVVIWAGTKHPEEAFRFLLFITSKQGQEIMVEEEGLPPVRRAAAERYLALDPDIDLSVFVEHATVGSPIITTRMAGDALRIGSILNDVLAASVMRNEQDYGVAILEARDVIQSIIAGTQ